MFCQRLEDTMKPSANLEREAVQWCSKMRSVNDDINAIFALISPQLYADGITSLNETKMEYPDHQGVQTWNSAFSGISVIVNRKTITHRDQGGRAPWYDILFSAGTYKDAYLDVPDLGASFRYKPGTVIAICGRLLRHGVKSWEGGNRMCLAYFMRNNVLHRQGIQSAGWVEAALYQSQMSSGYLARHAGIGTI